MIGVAALPGSGDGHVTHPIRHCANRVPLTDTVACAVDVVGVSIELLGTASLRAQPGMRSLTVAVMSSRVETVSVERPPHGISLATDSARSLPPTLNPVRLDT